MPPLPASRKSSPRIIFPPPEKMWDAVYPSFEYMPFRVMEPLSMRGSSLGSSHLGDISDIITGIQGLIGKIPTSDPTFGKFQVKLNDCVNLASAGGLAADALAAKCLYDLYNDVRDYIDKAGVTPKPAPQPAPTIVVEQSSSLLPILLVGGAGIAAWLLLS